MAPTTPNPNWPTLFAEGYFGGNPYYGSVSSVPAYMDMAYRLYRAWSVRRGKQFELDQVQPGEFHGQWVNKDGVLDPSNTTGWLYPNVVPYRGFRIRAQYPPSVNLVMGDTATGGEVTPLAAGTSGLNYLVTGTVAYGGNPIVAASGTAWQGTNVWQVSVPGGVSTGSNLAAFGYFAAVPITGTSYTASYHVRSATTGGNPTVTPFFGWVDESGSTVALHTLSNVSLTGSPSAAWTTITHTDTVPSGAVALAFGVRLATAPAGAWTFQTDGIQLEQASSASTFAIPGKNYPVYSGLIERYPQSWDFGGTYGVVSPVCVDTMALLSQTILKEAFIMDVLATSPPPAWFFPLNDASGTTTFAEQSGNTPPAGLFSSSYGAGTLTSGVGVTATDPTGKFLGAGGPVVTSVIPAANQGTVIDLTQAGITGPPSSGGWTRMLAFRTGSVVGTPMLATATAGLSPSSAGYNSNWYLQLQNGVNTNVAVSMYTDGGTNAGLSNSLIVSDNNWHLAVFTLSSDGKTLTLYVDAISATTTVGTDMHSHNTVNESVGGDIYKYSGLVGYGAFASQVDVALYAQWNTVLSAGTVANLYNSWRFGWQNDSSDERYSRILSWAGFLGTQTLDSGTTTTMGPANDVGGLDALTCLQNVVDTEGGRHFIGADGAANFQGRQRFFQAVTPMWTFGENQAGGEIPYVDISFDFDPTRISNAVSVTQVSSDQVYFAQDTTSQAAYGTRNLSRSNQSLNSEEVRGSAFFYLSRYKDPHLRIQTIRVDVASNPSLWPSILQFEIGQFVQVNRRDQFGVRPTITMNGFIEQIGHNGDDTGAWSVDLQISPVPATPYATFTSLRTTLAANATGGTNTITIAALPDAATNPVRSELTGNQLLLISGGGNAEFATIATGGVQNQAAGYTTAVLTLTANLAHSYSSGTTAVMEASGGNYDTLAVFDSVQFSY